MALLVVIVLFVLWAAVLGPRIVRRLREAEPVGSVDHFHHELHLLERASPKIVAPAYRLDTAYSGTGAAVAGAYPGATPGAAPGAAPSSTGLPAVSSMPGRPSLVLLELPGGLRSSGGRDEHHVSEDQDLAAGGVPGSRSRAPSSLAARDHAYRARQSHRRRRDILLGLVVTAVVTGPLGVLPSFHALWVIAGLAVLLLIGFVALAVHVQQVAWDHRAPHGDGRAGERARTPGSRRGAAGGRDPVEGWPGDVAGLLGNVPEAMAGYPGGWDDMWSEDLVEREPPRRAASGG